jgi:hypothetical protein
VLALASPTQATRPNTTINPCILYSDSAKHLKQFAEDVWAPDRWRRGDPPAKTIKAWRLKLHCVPSGWQKKLKQRWRELQGEYFDRRRAGLWRERVKPFVYPDGSRWAVPYPIAWCESGGDYFVGPSGAYGLIPAFPQYLPPRRQDEIARRLYVEQGEAPWAPYESGCAYR